MSTKLPIVSLLLLVALAATAATANPPLAPIVVDSYYGDYRVETKEAGLPAKSLDGPRRETWEAPPPADRRWRIGVLFPHLKDPYWRAVNAGIVAEARRQRIGMRLLSADGYDDLDQQRAAFNTLLEDGIDGIILASISYTALDERVEQAAAQGVPVVAVINDIYSPAIRAKALVPFHEMGYQAGQFVTADVPAGEKALVAFFPGPKGSGWAPESLKGFFRAQREQPGKTRLLPPRWGDTGYAEQRRLIEAFLDRHDDIDYLVGNAVAAEVAIDVIKERGLDRRIKIVATYLIPSLYDKVQAGLIAAAPSDMTVAQGRMAVDMMVRILDGEQPGEAFPFRAGPIIQTVTPENIGRFSYESLFGDRDFAPVFELPSP